MFQKTSKVEARQLWGCFEHIDVAMQVNILRFGYSPLQNGNFLLNIDAVQQQQQQQQQHQVLGWEPGFQGGLSVYNFHDVPPPEEIVWVVPGDPQP